MKIIKSVNQINVNGGTASYTTIQGSYPNGNYFNNGYRCSKVLEIYYNTEYTAIPNSGYKVGVSYWSSKDTISSATLLYETPTIEDDKTITFVLPSNAKYAVVTCGRKDDQSITPELADANINVLCGATLYLDSQKVTNFSDYTIEQGSYPGGNYSAMGTRCSILLNTIRYDVEYLFRPYLNYYLCGYTCWNSTTQSSSTMITWTELKNIPINIRFSEDVKSVAFTLARSDQSEITPSDIANDFKLSIHYDFSDGETPSPTPSSGLIVNSKIFHTVSEAWTDKDNIYESWPNSGLIIDGDQIVLIYNSSAAHVDKTNGDVMMRVKTSLCDWHQKKYIIQHDSTYSYQNPSACLMPNGDYFVIVCCTNSSLTGSVYYFKMLVSSDQGSTWTDNGFVKVNNENVIEECMMSLFCTSTGKLISFVGGIYGGRYIASDNNGSSWYYVGNDLGTSRLESGFWESDTGYIYSILRMNSADPYLVRLNASLTSYEVIYSSGDFNFPAYYNPTAIVKMNDGNLYLLAGSRRTDSEGNHYLIEAIVSEEDLLANKIQTRTILKYKTAWVGDWGYAEAGTTADGIIYGYFYGGRTSGNVQIYEMIGC